MQIVNNSNRKILFIQKKKLFSHHEFHTEQKKKCNTFTAQFLDFQGNNAIDGGNSLKNRFFLGNSGFSSEIAFFLVQLVINDLSWSLTHFQIKIQQTKFV